MGAELEFGDVEFCGERKTCREPREKSSEEGETQNQTQPSHGTGPESSPGRIFDPVLGQSSALTTAPAILKAKLIKQSTDRTAFYLTQKGTVNKHNNCRYQSISVQGLVRSSGSC